MKETDHLPLNIKILLVIVFVLSFVGLYQILYTTLSSIKNHFDRIDQLEWQVSDLEDRVSCLEGDGMCWSESGHKIFYTPPQPVHYLLRGSGHIILDNGQRVYCEGGDFYFTGSSGPVYSKGFIIVGDCELTKI